MTNNKIIDFLDNPKTKIAQYFSYVLIILIYVSILNAIISTKNGLFFQNYEEYFNYLNNFILLFFTIELLIRLIFVKNKTKYIFSIYGLIDILSVVPELISLIFFPSLGGALWIRAFKLFRIFRILKVIRLFRNLNGIIGKLVPYIASAIAYKGIIVLFENESWWINSKDLTIVIAVVGFSLAVLLGTKLKVVNSRIYQIEDAVCRIIGSLRDMQNNINVQKDLYKWSSKLEETLKYSVSEKKKEKKVEEMITLTDELEEKLEENKIGGPNTAGFHRDVAYLLHRTLAKTPINYEKFLKIVTILYTLTVILVVPGLIGFISSVLLVFVLGGMYYLIEDMDSPLKYTDDSFIDVRLDTLELFNKNYKYK
ncbi:ion transporter [Arcobacter sp.]|uniref:ion transporter n=1 Tax=unclassified Arcobacter TaxID=2593671 RepID=UPI003B00478A